MFSLYANKLENNYLTSITTIFVFLKRSPRGSSVVANDGHVFLQREGGGRSSGHLKMVVPEDHGSSHRKTRIVFNRPQMMEEFLYDVQILSDPNVITVAATEYKEKYRLSQSEPRPSSGSLRRTFRC